MEGEMRLALNCNTKQVNTHSLTGILLNSMSLDKQQYMSGFLSIDWACGGYYSEPYGEFSSPGWPSKYPPSQNCTWFIEAPPGVKIFLTFENVNLEEDIKRPCRSSFDFIEVYENHENSTFLCGRNDRFTYNSTGSKLYVQFTSDGRVEKSGFHAFYTFVYDTLNSNYTTLQTVSTPTALYGVLNVTSWLEFLKTDEENNSDSEMNSHENDKYIHYIDFHLQPTLETPIESQSKYLKFSFLCYM